MKKTLIMTSSQFHSKNKMGDEFYSILKLVSGEEIFALVCVDETDDEPILILHTPIKMKTLNNMGSQLNYIKVTPWMDMTDEDMFVMKMDKVITMSEVFDKEVIRIYNRYMNDKDRETNESVVTKDMGYLSSVTDARIFLEKLYKKDS